MINHLIGCLVIYALWLPWLTLWSGMVDNGGWVFLMILDESQWRWSDATGKNKRLRTVDNQHPIAVPHSCYINCCFPKPTTSNPRCVLGPRVVIATKVLALPWQANPVSIRVYHWSTSRSHRSNWYRQMSLPHSSFQPGRCASRRWRHSPRGGWPCSLQKRAQDIHVTSLSCEFI